MGSEGDHLPFRISRGRDEEREEYKTSISLRVGRQSSVAEAGAFLHPRCGDVTPTGKWTGPPIPPARAFIGAPANTPDHKTIPPPQNKNVVKIQHLTFVPFRHTSREGT
jgi:hypothetical protein